MLGDPAQLAAWSALGRTRSAPLAAALHIDTGMNRLGFDESQTRELAATPGLLEGGALPLIGFAGAPLTLAMFLIEGKSPGNSGEITRAFFRTHRIEAHQLLERFVVENYVPVQKKKRKRQQWAKESEHVEATEHSGSPPVRH